MKKLLLLMICAATSLSAQSPPSFTLKQVLSYPYPLELTAAPNGAAVAWVFNEQGVRNIYEAQAPDWTARKLTRYAVEDGQELGQLSFTPDGKMVVFVRGGDHDSNWPNDPPNPTLGTAQPKVGIWAVNVAADSAPRLLTEGDAPVVSPKGDRVVFTRGGQVYWVSLTSGKPAEQLFYARGTSSEWCSRPMVRSSPSSRSAAITRSSASSLPTPRRSVSSRRRRRTISVPGGRPMGSASRSFACRGRAVRQNRTSSSRRRRGPFVSWMSRRARTISPGRVPRHCTDHSPRPPAARISRGARATCSSSSPISTTGRTCTACPPRAAPRRRCSPPGTSWWSTCRSRAITSSSSTARTPAAMRAMMRGGTCSASRWIAPNSPRSRWAPASSGRR